MPLRTAFSGEIKYLQVLSEDGSADEALMPPLSEEQIRQMYELMALARLFDQRAVALQREGRISTYAPVIGEEAAQVGSVLALSERDWLFPMYRSNAALIARSVPMEMLLQYWGGDERGQQYTGNIFPVSIEVGTHVLHAVGAAMAAKLKGDGTAFMVFFGDGATSKGDFHEGMNFAGVFRAPCVFVCENNQYAISLPRARQSASQTLAQKALAYGVEGVQVDGNDVFAVYRAAREALEKARTGTPVMIECVTYRIGDHTTSDDASRYRSAAEVAEWQKKDPLERLRKYMQAQQLWSEEYQEKILADAEKKIAEAVVRYEAAEAPVPADMFSHVYAEPTAQMKEQMEEFK